MKLVTLENIFNVTYGVNLNLNQLIQCEDGINYVGRTEKNNGVTAKVELLHGVEPNPAGTISVSAGGSVLESFLQEKPYYSGRDLFYLTPKMELNRNELLFYCMCIRKNKFRYNFGRQPNKTLPTLKVPATDSIPKWVNELEVKDVSHIGEKQSHEFTPDLNIAGWREFSLYPHLFEMVAGKYYPATSYTHGGVPLISSTESNNGTTELTNLTPVFQGGCLTIGKVRCSTFYQRNPFCATSDVTVLIPKFDINDYSGVFIATVINQEKRKWNYGRQIRLNDCKRLKIKFPAIKVNDRYVPDLEFMESYIKTLSFSKNLSNFNDIVI